MVTLFPHQKQALKQTAEQNRVAYYRENETGEVKCNENR
nr:MAG TPA: hypothetical protein [Caudoviricetes sp.]